MDPRFETESLAGSPCPRRAFPAILARGAAGVRTIVLVVEDDPDIRGLVEHVLHAAAQGAEQQVRILVLGHCNGRDARLAGLDQRSDDIHHGARNRVEMDQHCLRGKTVDGLGQQSRLVDFRDNLYAGNRQEHRAQIGGDLLVRIHHDDPNVLAHGRCRPFVR